MLKRVTKVSSLLVAAASIVSMVPVMAADVQKVDAQEGTVYSGKAKGNGKFIIDGEINGKDEGAVYYVTDGKYNELKNADSGSEISGDIFENKYIEFDNGDYYIDLTNGDKTEDSIAADWHDDITSEVRKNIKADNDDRFDADQCYNNGKRIEAIGQVTNGNKQFMLGFTGNWSEFQYKLKNANTNRVTYSTVYSGSDGKYIDADYNLGNFNVATTGSAVNIKNTNDTYEITKDGVVYEIKAQIDSSMALSEGYDYILRNANISVWGRKKSIGGSYINMTNQFKYGSKSKSYDIANGDSHVEVFQKISKAQSSDDIDGIKYAKDASTYFKTDSDGKTQTLYWGISTNAAGITNWQPIGTKFYAQEVKLKSENGFYYTDLSDSDDVDNVDAWSISGGMVYCLSEGYIRMWNNVDSFEKLYKVDGSMNKFDVSDKDNIIVWNEDDGVYSIINNKAKKDEVKTQATTQTTTAASISTVTITGWAKAVDGTWSFVKADGTKAIGWYQDGTIWYYLNASGVMQTGWINDKGIWYYCNGSGAMLANTTVDGYVLGSNGAWIR